jgi:hypothetical protein
MTQHLAGLMVEEHLQTTYSTIVMHLCDSKSSYSNCHPSDIQKYKMGSKIKVKLSLFF